MKNTAINVTASAQFNALQTSWEAVGAARHRVSVVLPAHNEAKNLPYVLPRIPFWVYEVIVVDRGSSDGTADVARALMPTVRVIGQNGSGKGDALRAGFAAATGDIVVILDADGSTDPAEIPAYVGALLSGADFAKGTRFIQGGGTWNMALSRKLGNVGLTSLVQILFGGQYSDLCYGYNAFWAHVLPRLAPDAAGAEIEAQLSVRALRAGLLIAEVPSFQYNRSPSTSYLQSISEGLRMLRTIYKEWIKPTSAARAQVCLSSELRLDLPHRISE